MTEHDNARTAIHLKNDLWFFRRRVLFFLRHVHIKLREKNQERFAPAAPVIQPKRDALQKHEHSEHDFIRHVLSGIRFRDAFPNIVHACFHRVENIERDRIHRFRLIDQAAIERPPCFRQRFERIHCVGIDRIRIPANRFRHCRAQQHNQKFMRAQEIVIERNILARHQLRIARRLLLMFVRFGQILAGDGAIDRFFAPRPAAGGTDILIYSGTESLRLRGLADGARHFPFITRAIHNTDLRQRRKNSNKRLMGFTAVRAGAFAFFLAAICAAQSPAKPAFEAASIKPSGTPPGHHYAIDNSRVDMQGMPLKSLILIAYEIDPDQLSAPDWTSTALFDLSAKFPDGEGKQQLPAMLRALIEDRFKLTLHHVALQKSGYALVVANGGPKLKEAAPDNSPDESFMNGRILQERILAPESDGYWTVSSLGSGVRTFNASRITMVEFARYLIRYAERPVVDMTELKGPFHVTMDLPMPPITAAMQSLLDSRGVTIDRTEDVPVFVSIQKLGLLLEKRTLTMDQLIVDHIEKTPTEN